MKRTLKFAALLLGLFGMLAMSSCSKNEDLIVGKWQLDTVTVNGQTQPMGGMMTMIFQFNEDNSGSIEMAVFGETMNEAFTYAVDGDKLNLTQDGETITATIKNLNKKNLEIEVEDMDEEEGLLMGTMSFSRL